MPRIVETIVTTTNAAGEAHIAPLGLIAEGDFWIIAPFRPSRTLDNLREVPFAVSSHTDDVRVFAGCLTGRRSWPTRPAEKIKGVVLESAVSHWELAVDQVAEDDQRPRFSCRIVHGRATALRVQRAQGAARVRGAGVRPGMLRRRRSRASPARDRDNQDCRPARGRGGGCAWSGSLGGRSREGVSGY
jgi:hypothetical protein